MVIESEEQWEVYPSKVGDDFAMFAVNLAPHADAPFQNLRWLYVVRINFDALPSGMPDPDTNHFLYEVEDALVGRTGERGSIHVGRLTVAGRRELFFYAATNDADLVLGELQEDFPDLDVDTVGQLDAEWKIYFDFLYPRPVDFQRIHNQRIVRLLAEHGDDPTIPRKVDHFAHFPNPQARRTFAREVAAQGFEIGEEEEADDGDLRFGLTFHAVSTVELSTIDRTTTPLFLRAEELGGQYDGWGCTVATSDDD